MTQEQHELLVLLLAQALLDQASRQIETFNDHAGTRAQRAAAWAVLKWCHSRGEPADRSELLQAARRYDGINHATRYLVATALAPPRHAEDYALMAVRAIVGPRAVGPINLAGLGFDPMLHDLVHEIWPHPS